MKPFIQAFSNRREFIKFGMALSAGLAIPGMRAYAKTAATEGQLFTRMGVNAPLSKAAAVAEQGADFLLIGVNKFLVPDEPVQAFEEQLRLMDQSPIPVLSCNNFLRGDALRCVGPEAKTESVLRFAKTAFQRAKRAGVERIIFGSSGSRKIPEGWSKAQADEQFIDLLKRMGDIAGAEGVVVAVENLQIKECNYLTRLREVGEIVGEVKHPHIRMLADLYHGSVMEDPPADLRKYSDLIEMVEIAEADGRTAPGVNGQDFRPYFNALRAGGYQGLIEVEGKWEVEQLANAFATIREQSAG